MISLYVSVSLSILSLSLCLQVLLEALRGVPDLERGLCRVHYGKAPPSEFLSLMQAFTR